MQSKSKCSQKTVKIQSKFSLNSVKMQSKFSHFSWKVFSLVLKHFSTKIEKVRTIKREIKPSKFLRVHDFFSNGNILCFIWDPKFRPKKRDIKIKGSPNLEQNVEKHYGQNKVLKAVKLAFYTIELSRKKILLKSAQKQPKNREKLSKNLN